MKRLCWTVAVLLSAISSRAQYTPSSDVSVQYSPLYILKGYTIWNNGVSASASRNVNDWLGFVGDFGVYRGHVPEEHEGLQFDLGPGRIRYFAATLRQSIPNGPLPATFEEAAARLVGTSFSIIPEARA
jgi:hypothetical protein